jgi:hypothetical protein
MRSSGRFRITSGLPVIRQPLQLIAVQTAHPSRQWTNGVPLEDAARQQLLNVAQLPFIYKWVAAMPDVHWGIGATVGSVIPTRGAIIPAAVGVDIGCGMMACRLLCTPTICRTCTVSARRLRRQCRTDVLTMDARTTAVRGRTPAHHLEVWGKMEPAYKAIIEKYPKLNHVSASIIWERSVRGTTSSRSVSGRRQPYYLNRTLAIIPLSSWFSKWQ